MAPGVDERGARLTDRAPTDVHTTPRDARAVESGTPANRCGHTHGCVDSDPKGRNLGAPVAFR